MRRLSCVVTVVVVALLALGLGVAGAQNQSGNEAALKQSAQQPILQEQPTKEQAPRDQGAQQQLQQQPTKEQAPQDQSAQQPILQEQPTKEQTPQDQGAQQPILQEQLQQQGVRTLPIRALAQVSIQDTSFAPAHSTIAPLTSVAWSNQGAEPHTVTADDGSFDSGTLNPGEHFLLAFEGQGTVTYHCALHPEMVGSITVGEGGGGSVPPGGSQAPAKQQQPSENASESTDGGSGN